jgi:hypothetical protein
MDTVDKDGMDNIDMEAGWLGLGGADLFRLAAQVAARLA